jgi:hypothetical protein
VAAKLVIALEQIRDIRLMKELKQKNTASLHDVVHAEDENHASLRVHGRGGSQETQLRQRRLWGSQSVKVKSFMY